MELIKPGKKLNKIRCVTCQALLAYEDTDVYTTNKLYEKTEGETTIRYHRKYIICPCCKYATYLDDPRSKKGIR